MQMTKRAAFGGGMEGSKAFYFDFKWTSYSVMKMQIAPSSRVKYRWDGVAPAAARSKSLLCCGVFKQTLPEGCLLLATQFLKSMD